MKKIVNESINEEFQEDLHNWHNWMEQNDINIDDKDQRENVYALCKKVFEMETKMNRFLGHIDMKGRWH